MKNFETPVVSHKDLLIKKLARIMKITTALLLLVCMQVSAIGFSQSRITIKMASLDLKKALFEVEKKTDYRFLFAEEVVKGKPKVTINLVDATLDETLNKILANTGINYKILLTIFLFIFLNCFFRNTETIDSRRNPTVNRDLQQHFTDCVVRYTIAQSPFDMQL